MINTASELRVASYLCEKSNVILLRPIPPFPAFILVGLAFVLGSVAEDNHKSANALQGLASPYTVL